MNSLTLNKIIDSLSTGALNYFFPGIEIQSSDDVFLAITPCPKTSRSRFSPRNCMYAEVSMIPEEMPICEEVTLPEESELPDEEQELKTKAFLKELEALQEKYGVTIEEIEAILAYKVKLSRLRITRSHAIILDDFDRQEVRMDKLTKSVFLLFLRHPEGIRYKDLPDFEDELSGIYMSISGRSDLEAMKKSISDLTDPVMSNSINEKVSKAKKAFRNVVDERVAKFYYIDGKPGAAKSIPLDRSLVIWD